MTDRRGQYTHTRIELRVCESVSQETMRVTGYLLAPNGHVLATYGDWSNAPTDVALDAQGLHLVCEAVRAELDKWLF